MIPATAFTILFALWCSRDDAQQIARHSKIYHGLQWCFRAAVVVAVCYWWASWWLALGMAGLFSAVFRWDLNGRRGLDWRYVSPSNWYDRLWIWLYSVIDHSQYELGSWGYKTIKAGTMAYIVEALLFIGVVVAYLC